MSLTQNNMGRKQERANFSDQCFSIAQQLREFNAVRITQEVAKRKKKDRHVSGIGANVEVQQRTLDVLAEQTMDGLEEQAKKVGRKGAFKGFKTIFGNGKKRPSGGAPVWAFVVFLTLLTIIGGERC